MINELNFFRSACGEKPIDYSTFGEAKWTMPNYHEWIRLFH
jgi:hypothetical protein